jgi:hypothetical protein
LKKKITAQPSRLKKTAVTALVIVVSGMGGFLFAQHGHVFRTHIKQKLVIGAANQPSEYNRNDVVLANAFTDPLIELQLLPPATTIEEVSTQLAALYYPVADFFTAYDSLLLKQARHQGDVFQVDYVASGREYTAYTYYRPGRSRQNDTCAVLAIPGSGSNQSTAIFHKDPQNYHGDVLALFEEKCDTFVLVKPNEDFLAVHNGKKKLNEKYLLRFLINRGGSYSAYYIVNSVALVKWLKQKYQTTLVIGLSQGGEAAFLNALQTAPTAAIVASGFSLLTDTIDYAGFNQILLPGYKEIYTNAKIYDIIATSPTKYLFTYGKQETTIYKAEAEEKLVCRYFGDLSNVKCRIHDGGHAFDREALRKFFHEMSGL